VVERTPDGRLLQGDVVGDLVGLDAQTAVIDAGDGLVEVPLALVTAARTAPPSSADELALQRVEAASLRAGETADLDGWVLRADHGFTRRANSVLPVRQLRRPLDDALEQAADWYAARDLPLKVQVPIGARRLLDAALAERGWPAELHTLVLARRLDSPTPTATPAAEVEIAVQPDDAWLAVYRGGAGLVPSGRALLTRHPTVGFAALRRDGRTVAVGRGAVDDGWLGIMAVETDPAYRGAGLARAVTAALWAWGAAHGARRTYLQVSVDNEAARALYATLGYWTHHDYHYRRPYDAAAGDPPPEAGPWG
jgi:ribosomal protein S18 acetylase RimI-like enzyme